MPPVHSVQFRYEYTLLLIIYITHCYSVVGLFLLVLEYVLKHGHSDDVLYARSKMKCYELLRRIARKNPKV